MMPLYKITLESGQEYNIYAESEKDAWSKALEIWPEIFNKDVRDISLVS